jgi:predicted  nucleic acid-binding Zn-ribbon protein
MGKDFGSVYGKARDAFIDLSLAIDGLDLHSGCDEIRLLKKENRELREVLDKVPNVGELQACLDASRRIRDDLDKEIGQLKRDVSSRNTTIETLRSAGEESAKQRNEFRAEISGLNGQIETQAETIRALTAERGHLCAYIGKPGDSVDALKAEIAGLKDGALTQAKTIKALAGERDGLNVQVQRLINSESNLRRAHEGQVVTLRHKLVEKGDSITSLANQLEASVSRNFDATWASRARELANALDSKNDIGTRIEPALSKRLRDAASFLSAFAFRVDNAGRPIATLKPESRSHAVFTGRQGTVTGTFQFGAIVQHSVEPGGLVSLTLRNSLDPGMISALWQCDDGDLVVHTGKITVGVNKVRLVGVEHGGPNHHSTLTFAPTS